MKTAAVLPQMSFLYLLRCLAGRHSKGGISAVLACLLLLGLTVPVSAKPWFNTDWSFRQEIAVSSDLSDETLDNYPLLVHIVDPDALLFDLITDPDDHSDLRFVDEDNDSLPYEMEEFDADTGVLRAWVRVPEVLSTGSSIYLYFGNPETVPSTEDAEEVWDDHELVMHLQDAEVDAGGRYSFATDGVADAAGQVGGAQEFQQDISYIDVDDPIVDSTWQTFTFEAWIRPDAASHDDFPRLLNISQVAEPGVTIDDIDDWLIAVVLNRGGAESPGISYVVNTDVGDAQQGALQFADLDDGNWPEWYYVALRLNLGADQITAFVDAASDTAAVSGNNLLEPQVVGDDTGIRIGNFLDLDEGERPFRGLMDELRFSQALRSDAWLLANYRTQNPATYDDYLDIGLLEVAPDTKLWLGEVDSDWFEPDNWTPAGVPESSDAVIISSSAERDAVINDSAGALAGSVRIEADAELTMEAGSDLTVSGDWINESPGGFVAEPDSLVRFNGVGEIDAGEAAFFDIEVATGADLTFTSDLPVVRDWIRTGGGIDFGTFAIEFVNAAVNSQVFGTNRFNDFTVTANGKTLSFESGETQRIDGAFTIAGSAGSENLIRLLSITAGSQWTIDYRAGDDASVDFAFVQDSAVFSNNIPAANSRNNGNNETTSPGWVFEPATITWEGTENSDWDEPDNWDSGYVPNDTDDVVLADQGNSPVLNLDVTVRDLTVEGDQTFDQNEFGVTINRNWSVEEGATHDLGGGSLDVTDADEDGEIENAGTVRLEGGEDVDLVLDFDVSQGLVEYYGTDPSYTGLALGDEYFDLSFTGSGSWTLDRDIQVVGNLSIGVDATLDVSGDNHRITVGGDWENNGTFEAQAGLVEFDGDGAIVNNEEFHAVEVSAGERSSAAGFSTGALLEVGGGELDVTGGDVDAHTLTLSGGDMSVAEAASLTVSGGDFSITEAASVYDGGGDVTVSTGDLIITAGSYNAGGATTISAGNLSFDSGDDSAPTGTVDVVDGAASFSGTGAFTHDAELTVGGDMSVSNGTVTGGGNITVTAAMVLDNALGTLEGNARTITVGGDWNETAAVFDAGDSLVVLDGGAATLRSENAFNDLTVDSEVTLDNAVVVGGDLEITADGTLDVSGDNHRITVGGDWENNGTFEAQAGLVEFDGDDPQSMTTNDDPFNNLTKSGDSRLTVSSGDLTVGGVLQINTNSELDVAAHTFSINDFQNQGRFRLVGTQAIGDQQITSFNTTSGTVEYYNPAGPIDIHHTEFHSLDVNKGGTTARLTDNTVVNGDLTLSGGTLDVTTDNYQVTVGGDWDGDAGGSFQARNGEVIFDPGDGATIRVLGDNTFNDFTLEGENITVEFQQERLQVIVGVWYIRGEEGSEVDLTAEDLDVDDVPDPDYVGNEEPAEDQWSVDLQGTLDFDYVRVGWSFAETVIVLPPDRDEDPDDGVDIEVFASTTNWLRIFLVSATATRDTTGSGKIDRIAVIMPGPIRDENDPFSQFEVEVEGYEIKDYEIVGNVLFIVLHEKPELDTGETPRWRIVVNQSLVDATTGIRLVTLDETADFVEEIDGEFWATPDDEAEPVVGYTLSIPGRDQIFVHFSEPLDLSGATIGYGGAAVVDNADPAPGGLPGQEFILQLSEPVTEEEIGAQTLITLGGVEDPAGNELVARAVYDSADAVHRVSDIVVGRQDQGLIEPVFARNTERPEIDPDRGGIGTVRAFDGSEFLQTGEIVLQAFQTDYTETATSAGDLDLVFDAGVPARLIRNGMWLGGFDEAQFSGIVPYPVETVNETGAPVTVNDNDNLLEFLLQPPTNLPEREDLGFWFRLQSVPDRPPLFFGTIDRPDSSDWFRTVRPWKFQYRDVRTQRGGVTIHNNVINPERGEKAELHYELDSSGMVTINVFNLAGDLVEQLYRGRRSAGEYSTTWDGRNRGGYAVARGIYFIRVVGPGIDEYRKVMVVK